jgi:hypothetical protein
VDNRQYTTHHLRIGRKQVAQRKRYTQHPLPNRSLRKHLVHQVCSTINHPPGATRRAEATSLTTERYQLLIVTGLTSNAQKAMLEATALQVIVELPDNITGQPPTLLCQHVLKLRPVFFYQSIKKRVFGLVSLVLKWI